MARKGGHQRGGLLMPLGTPATCLSRDVRPERMSAAPGCLEERQQQNKRTMAEAAWRRNRGNNCPKGKVRDLRAGSNLHGHTASWGARVPGCL